VAVRDALPTLTEDDLRSAGERETQPPPEPMADLVRRMMAQTDGDAAPAKTPLKSAPVTMGPQAAPNPAAQPAPAASAELSVGDEIDLADLPPSLQADLVDDLVKTSLERLGSRAHVPVQRLSPERARELALDNWAGFILSMIDGATSIEEILDTAPIPPHVALRILCELRDQGVIDVRPR
jgi:hypothetical protein